MASLTGIFAAAATPLKVDLSIDTTRLIAHCRWLLNEGGCDGVNLLGTTGEATSFSVEQRLDAMRAVAESGLPMERFMVGTGAAALSDAVRLTSGARELGFAGALLVPPFYYKGIDDDSVYAYVARVIEQASGGGRMGIYLYHIPQMSAVAYNFPVIEKLVAHFPEVLAGIKDSSGDFENSMGLAERFPGIAVFPGSEGFLAKAPEAGFAGCISATTNINGAFVSRGWKARTTEAGQASLRAGGAIRDALAKFPFVPGVKWTLAELQGDPEWKRVHPPLRGLTDAEWTALRGMLADTELFSAQSAH